MFTGYMDDSANGERTIAVLGCLIADGKHWVRFEKEWKILLEQTNCALMAAGLPTIRRYHASDCSTLNDEFEKWDPPMTHEITKEIRNIFSRHPVVIAAFGAEISDVAEIFPEAGEKAHDVAFSIFLTHIMNYASDKILSDLRWPDESISLIHDRGDYNGVLFDTFESERTNSKYSNKFASIIPMGWEMTLLLQPADFFTYECFKAIERETKGNKRRKSLELILELDSVAGRCMKLGKPELEQFRTNLGIEGLKTLFRNARINEKTT